MTIPRTHLRTTIGAALRAERERRRVSIDAVARGTLVRQDFLELIDADRLEELPSGAYAKGFIRSYVAYLGLDPKPFLDAYEERCGRPEPELSPLVTRGVRVPPAAQRRAWSIAISSAAGLILLLLFLGVFRSGDEPAEPPLMSTSSRARATTAPNTLAAVMRIEVLADETWVEVDVDGQRVFEDVLQRGEYKTFKGEDAITLFVARAQAVRITSNGEILGTPSDVSYRGTFTRETSELPTNEAAVAASADPAPEASAEPVASEEPPAE